MDAPFAKVILVLPRPRVHFRSDLWQGWLIMDPAYVDNSPSSPFRLGKGSPAAEVAQPISFIRHPESCKLSPKSWGVGGLCYIDDESAKSN
jgi:hypothetical protein